MVSGPFSYGVQNLQMFPVTGTLWSCVDIANSALGARGHGFELKNLRVRYAVALSK